jgi:hypothetical protein
MKSIVSFRKILAIRSTLWVRDHERHSFPAQQGLGADAEALTYKSAVAIRCHSLSNGCQL